MPRTRKRKDVTSCSSAGQDRTAAVTYDSDVVRIGPAGWHYKDWKGSCTPVLPSISTEVIRMRGNRWREWTLLKLVQQGECVIRHRRCRMHVAGDIDETAPISFRASSSDRPWIFSCWIALV
jgi:hypothetical protein